MLVGPPDRMAAVDTLVREEPEGEKERKIDDEEDEEDDGEDGEEDEEEEEEDKDDSNYDGYSE